MVRILALRERFEHMSSISGYDALYQHLSEDTEVRSVFGDFTKIYPRGIGRILAIIARRISTSGFYSAQSTAAELRLLISSAVKHYNIIHYSYGESYYGIGHLSNKYAATIVTHHQPVSWWRANENRLKKYNRVDKVIALSEYDRDYFDQYLCSKTICIPHGVDIEYFTPTFKSSIEQPLFRVIFSGRYLRDMETLAAVIKQISRADNNIQFDIIYFDKREVWQPYLKDIMRLPNVHWYSRIGEERLRTLYQNADCCLIPLEDCTANNAILEAMACGLPIISTALPAISTYLDKTMSFLAQKGHVDELCDALLLLHSNESLKNNMSISARKKAVNNFDWRLIARQTEFMFKTIS